MNNGQLMKMTERDAFYIIFAILISLIGSAQAQINRKISDEELHIRSGVIEVPSVKTSGIGSGFVFGSQHDIVTCWHVKNGAETVFHETNLVFLSGMNHYELKLKYMLPKYDLAVFTPSPEIKTPAFRSGDFKRLRPGDYVMYVGYNTRLSTVYNLVTSIGVSQITAVGSALNDGVIVDFLEFEGQGIPGFSGGPVFTTDGDVVAIMREAWTRKGLQGGGEILVNRAFSIEILSTLNEQLYKDDKNEQSKTNGTQIGIMEILRLNQK